MNYKHTTPRSTAPLETMAAMMAAGLWRDVTECLFESAGLSCPQVETRMVGVGLCTEDGVPAPDATATHVGWTVVTVQ